MPNFKPGYDKNRDYTLPDEQGFAAPPYFYKWGLSSLPEAKGFFGEDDYDTDLVAAPYDVYQFLRRNEEGYLVNECQIIWRY